MSETLKNNEVIQKDDVLESTVAELYHRIVKLEPELSKSMTKNYENESEKDTVAKPNNSEKIMAHQQQEVKLMNLSNTR